MKDTLANLLSLQQELREINKLNELAFFIAHQSKVVIDYQRAIVWSSWQNKHIQIKSISGITRLNKTSPYQLSATEFIDKLITYYAQNKEVQTIDSETAVEAVNKIWLEPLSKYVTFYFFRNSHKEVIGGILLLNNELPEENEFKQFDWIAHSYKQAWLHLSKPRNIFGQFTYYFKSRKRRIIWLIIVAAFLAMFIRVPQSVLAPATIIAKDPMIITVPMEGVIETVFVKPEQYITQGETLFDMDKRDLLNAHELAQKELSTATAKYKTAVQSSYQDIEKRAEIQVLQALMQEKQLEVDYTAHLINESDVKSPINGIAIIDTPNQWFGKPVVTGENVMQVATPGQVEIEIWLPVADAINFNKGDKVKLFLNADPLNPVYGIIDYASFEATITPSQILAYQVIARINSNQDIPKIGSQGTAKLMGNNVSLFYYLFRKPITTLRQFFGW
ncbi:MULTISPECIES: efflux RND transporter periplasmic adaptor subunit [Cysteiniphilum]|uniref:efflux RND transporter periplasmic adaptor subunit n=1 Tax=Cysteiniphilum TaxID=2056696 RepID=UPI0017834598|nr:MULTISPECIES: HlyD family efflux transporter periplasmic adaptor subunit [Cysteiniphilum]